MFPRGSRFQFVPGMYSGSTRAISCDGLVPGAGLDLTHWQGNRTPQAFKADTSTEIALKFIASTEADAWAGAVVVNNHFDTDGALSIWTLLEPDLALGRRELLVAAAEAGDFDEWPALDQGLWLDASVRALGASAADDAAAYAAVLPQLAGLLTNLENRRDLWGAEWDQLHAAVDAFENGRLRAETFASLALVEHTPGQPEVPGPILARRFLPAARRYLLAFDQGQGAYAYRYERPRYAWADTVQRPLCPAPDAEAILAQLGDDWSSDELPGLTGIVQTVRPIGEPPQRVAQRLRAIDPA